MAFASAVMSVGTARAQPGPVSVAVSTQSCGDAPPVAIAPFLAILTAELRADGVERVSVASAESSADEAQSLATLAIRAERCDAPQRDIVVHIEDAATGKSLERHVPLTDVEEPSRPRALALAVAELLRASWLELAMPDAPPAHTAVPIVVRQAVESRVTAMAPGPPAGYPPGAPSGDRDISATAVWRAFPTSSASLVGGQLAIAVAVVGKDWLARFDGGAVFGATHDVLGNVALGEAWLGAALLYSSPPEATFSVAIGPRVDAGIAWASGNPLDQMISSNVGSGAISSVSLLASLRYRFDRSWRAALELQTGAVVVPFEAQADSRRVTGIDGALFGLAIGVAQLR
jgi:hypothetical protein